MILAASSINSPKLLMLSGIGPAKHLAEHGIAPLADRAGVGANLQDHLEVYVQFASKLPIHALSILEPSRQGAGRGTVALTGGGPGASNQFESTGFIRSRAGIPVPRPAVFHFLPIAVRYDGRAAAGGHGFQAHVGPMRSASRGSVTLRSSDPGGPRRASPSTTWRMTTTGVISERRSASRARFFAQEALSPYVASEIQPGTHLQSDDEIDGFIREHAESAYHPCGTCRMGAADDPAAVVDSELRVDRGRGDESGRQFGVSAHHQRQYQWRVDHGRRVKGFRSPILERPPLAPVRTRFPGSIRAVRRVAFARSLRSPSSQGAHPKDGM